MRHKVWLVALSAVLGLALGAGLTLILCGQADPEIPSSPSGGTQTGEPTDHERLYTAAVTVARAINTSDYAALGAWTHPERGCLFAPFSTVDRQKNLTFLPAQIAAMGGDTTEYAWGAADQFGQPVTMTPVEFFRDYLQTRDFSEAPGVGFDTVMRVGNAVENVLSEYADCRVVDLYDPGTGKDTSGADWASLKLVFAGGTGELKLVAVVRSVYTEQ